jgi:D-alanine-D-alanine ligase
MHKILAKKVFEASGIPTPQYSVFRHDGGEFEIKKILAKHKFPVFVKAPQSGSSKLMGRAENEQQLRNLLTELGNECESILVETGITGGDEFSCPVIEKNGVAKALMPIYIKPNNAEGYFDYNAKYLGESEEICPPPPPFNKKETIEYIQRTAVAVHTALDCNNYSRTDIILKDGIAYVLEINTLPGMTAQSLLPKAFSVDGGKFSELLDIIIRNAE